MTLDVRRAIVVLVIGLSMTMSAQQAGDGLAQETGGSPEIGVFALRLKDPSAAPDIPVNVPSAQRIARGSVVIFSWSDANEGAPDLGCVHVVRRHVERVDVE